MIQFIRHKTARLIAGIIGAEALVVMTGWIFGIEQMTRILPVGTGMRFITSILFLFSSIALYFMSRAVQDEDEVALVILPGTSVVILLVTVTLFVSTAIGTSTGIENAFLVSTSPVEEVYSKSSTGGWPSIPTMVNFTIFGLVGMVSLFPGRLRARTLIYAGYLISIIGLLAVAVYIFNIPEIYHQTRLMSLNSALLFILLGLGLVQIRRPETKQ